MVSKRDFFPLIMSTSGSRIINLIGYNHFYLEMYIWLNNPLPIPMLVIWGSLTIGNTKAQ